MIVHHSSHSWSLFTMAALTSVYVLNVFLCLLALCGFSKGKRCFHCEDFQYDGSTSIVRTLLDGWRSPNCPKPLSEVSDGSMGDKGIDTLNCGTPAPNKVYKCGYMQGRLHASYIGVSVPMNIFIRDCLEVDKNLEDGCHKRNSNQDDASYLDGLLGDIASFGLADFVGELCVCSGEMCYPSNVSSFRKISMPLLTGLSVLSLVLYTYLR